MLKKEHLERSLLLIAVVFILIISPVFSQKKRGGRRGRNYNTIEDPNNSNDIEQKQQTIITTKKTLEQRVFDLEYEVYKLNNIITNLNIDIGILTMELEDFKLEIIENKRIKKNRVIINKTERERDREIGIFPIFPGLKYDDE